MRAPDGVPTIFSRLKWWARRKGAFAHPTRAEKHHPSVQVFVGYFGRHAVPFSSKSLLAPGLET
jgi:hypothetical protein